jgi:dolichyl-phosphate beta-glucosyltransferase
MVIPIRDEGERFQRFLGDLADCPERPVTEFVVVDDGSTSAMRAVHSRAMDAFADRMRKAGRLHRIRLVPSPVNGGKGSAIRLGWGEGAADWLGFVDGDGAVPAREVWRLATSLERDATFDALLGSRGRAPGRTVRRQALRALQGAAFARIANALLRIGVADPQCGLKFFRGDLLRPLLPALRERGWSLDPEILLLLRGKGGRFREEPIDWTEHGSSKTVFGVDAVKMLLQVIRLRCRIGAAPLAEPSRYGEPR